MTPGTRNITFTAGDDYANAITIQNGDGTPIDVTGRTYTARAIDQANVVILNFTCTVTNAAAGQLTVAAGHATTSVTPGEYTWALAETASGVVSTLLAGGCTVLARITA